MRKFYIQTYGCQMNVYDSRLIHTLFVRHGFQPVDNENDADILVVNSCSVRKKAEQKALDYAKGWRNKGKFVVFIGCVAVEHKDKLIDQGVADLVLGHRAYGRLPELIEKGVGVVEMDSDELLEFTALPLDRPAYSFSEFVTIMEGCDNFCSYCIVPFTRGRETYRPAEHILEEIKNLEKQGVIEVTLLGQNINSYFDGQRDFSELLEFLAQNVSLYRLRFTTLNPRDVSVKMLKVIQNHLDVLTDWLHLPVQAGSTKVLRDMRRGYTKEEFIEMAHTVRKFLPEAVITTDIMVGFPTETESDFEDTLDLVRKVEFDHAFMFIYSPRPRTKASYWNDLPYEVKNARLRKLIDTVNEVARKRREQMLGKIYEVLVEGPSRKDPTRSAARTRGYLTVVLDRFLPPGERVKVKIVGIKGLTPLAKVLD